VSEGEADQDWVLATVERHDPDEQGATVTIDMIRSMTMEQVESVRAASNLMGYVSGHALNGPLRRMADELAGFVRAVVWADRPPEQVTTHTDATLAFDNFLNQLPLFWGRVLRNMRLFVGEQESKTLRDSFSTEWTTATPWRLLWELRNACQHTMLPTDVIELASSRRGGGQTVVQWSLSIDKWRALDPKFPQVLQFLPSTMSFWPLVTDVIRFCEDQVTQCFLLAGEHLDNAAMLVLGLMGEALAATESTGALGVMVLQYSGTPERRLMSQIPLNQVQCAEVLLGTDLARERSGRSRVRPHLGPEVTTTGDTQ
jgi:hypothetical protein